MSYQLFDKPVAVTTPPEPINLHEPQLPPQLHNIAYYLEMKDTQTFILFPTDDYNEIIIFCFYSEQRPLSEKTFIFLQERPKPYIFDGFIRIDNLQFFIKYLDSWRKMINKLDDFYFKKDGNENFLLSDLYLSSGDAEKRLQDKNFPLHHFILRGSHSQLHNLAVTYVRVVEGDDPNIMIFKCVNVLIESVLGGWSIKEEGKLIPEIYPTLTELIMKCKVFLSFCFENATFSKDEM